MIAVESSPLVDIRQHSSPSPFKPLAYAFGAPQPHVESAKFDDKGRQNEYVESAAQRRERLDFLKRREWARRLAQYVSLLPGGGTTGASNGMLPMTYLPAFRKLPLADSDESEPFLIYSSSAPTTALSPYAADATSSRLSSSITFSPRRSRRRSHRRQLSLSSISEVAEED